jgi:hypothetical protein
MPVISQNWITYKVVLRDRFGNAILRDYKFLNTIRPFSAFLKNEELDLDINFNWGEFQLTESLLFPSIENVPIHVVRN